MHEQHILVAIADHIGTQHLPVALYITGFNALVVGLHGEPSTHVNTCEISLIINDYTNLVTIVQRAAQVDSIGRTTGVCSGEVLHVGLKFGILIHYVGKVSRSAKGSYHIDVSGSISIDAGTMLFIIELLHAATKWLGAR